MSDHMKELVSEFLGAMAAGVSLTLQDWYDFDEEERVAWLAARKILCGDVKPGDESVKDPGLRAALESASALEEVSHG